MMPMPKPLDSDTIGAAVTASKNVDCLNVKNVGDMYLGYGKNVALHAACLHGNA